MVQNAPSTVTTLSSRTAIVWVVTIAAILGIGVALGILLAQTRDAAIARTHGDILNLVRILDSGLQGRVSLVDLAIVETRSDLQSHLSTGVPRLDRLVSSMKRRLNDVQAFESLVYADAEGNVADITTRHSGEGMNIRSMSFFRELQEESADRLIFGKPFRANEGKSLWLQPIARPYTDASGKFAGVVVGTIALNALQDIMQTMDVGKRGSVAIWNTDRILLTRFPPQT